MVWIVIDDHVVGIPQPAVHIAYFPRRNAPIPAVEPKTAWTSATQSPAMARTKSACKMAVFIRLVHVVLGIGAARIMPHPHFSVIDMRRIGMPRLVAVIPVLLRWVRSTVILSRSVLRHGLVLRRGWFAPLVLLCECGRCRNEHRCQRKIDPFHRLPPALLEYTASMAACTPGFEPMFLTHWMQPWKETQVATWENAQGPGGARNMLSKGRNYDRAHLGPASLTQAGMQTRRFVPTR